MSGMTQTPPSTPPLNTPPVISRMRHGLATNSSSSHSMVVIPAGRDVHDASPEDRRTYDTGFVAVSEDEKRHVLAGMLVTQAPWLWGRGVVIPRPPAGTDWMDLTFRGERDQQRKTLENAAYTDAWDARAPEESYVGQSELALPRWVSREISALCGLPLSTDLSGHWTASSLGGNLQLPRAEQQLGPDPVAWAAFTAVMLDPSTAYLAAEENSWDPLEELPSARPRFEKALNSD